MKYMIAAGALVMCGSSVFAEGSNLTVHGLIDAYYENNFNKPLTDTVFPRSFDNLHDRLRVNNAELTLAYNLSRVKLAATLWLGDNADLLHDSDTTGSDFWRVTRNLYAAWTMPGSAPVTFTVGKFDTWIGLESMRSTDNPNLSNGLLFTLAEPAYHTGVKAGFELSPKVTANVAAVTGWGESINGDPDTSIGAWFDFEPNEQSFYRFGFYSGREGSNASTNNNGLFGGINFGSAGTSKVNLVNLLYTRVLNDSWRVAFDGVYANAQDNPNKGKWAGAAIYGWYMLNDKESVCGRFEVLDDHDGLRTGTPSNLNSLTLTYNRELADNLHGKVEFRRDMANQSFFSSDSGNRKAQTSLAVGLTLRF